VEPPEDVPLEGLLFEPELLHPSARQRAVPLPQKKTNPMTPPARTDRRWSPMFFTPLP
jgi:hypothetical protein